MSDIIISTVPAKKFTTKRTHYSNDGTYSTIDDEGKPFAVVCERPWLNNQHGISCIPEGSYFADLYKEGKFAGYYLLRDVKDRDGIFIHGGNLPTDSAGCLLIGENFGIMNGFVSVLNSRTTPGEGFLEFMQRCAGAQTIQIEILDRR